MSFKDVIKAEGEKTAEALKPNVDSFKEAMESINSKLESVTENNVETEFGAFIYKALGNVNGSINTAKVEQTTKRYYWGRSERGIDKVVTGRRFGFQLTGRKNTFYLEERDLLPGLTGMHVDLIKRPSQQVLARDFYAFKCAYFNRYKKLFNDFSNHKYEVSIPVDIANMYTVKTNGNDDDEVKVKILDKVVKGTVKSIHLSMPQAKWIDDTNVGIKDIHYKNTLSYNYGLKTAKPASVLIETAVGDETIKSTLSLSLLRVDNNTSFIDNWFTSDYDNNKIMNMNDVLNCEPIQNFIKAHMEYNKGVAKTFEYLRLKYAKNLILNGVF